MELIIAYVATGITILGFFLMFMSRHDFFKKLNPTLQRLPSNISKQFNSLVLMQFKQNDFLQSDQLKINKELLHSGIHFFGRKLTFKLFVVWSLLSGLLAGVISFVLTSRYGYVNIPADVTLSLMGFILPRFMLTIFSIRTKFKYQTETSECLYIITSSLRRHPNFDRAIEDSIPRFPKYSRWLFESGIQGIYAGRFKNITQMLFWASEEIQQPNWKEFAYIALNESATGIKDRLNRMTILTNRADELLSVQKDERRGLKVQIRKVGIPLTVLIIVIIIFTFFDPKDGMYLYTTPTGKLLITVVYLVITLIIMTFTWLFYQV